MRFFDRAVMASRVFAFENRVLLHDIVACLVALPTCRSRLPVADGPLAVNADQGARRSLRCADTGTGRGSTPTGGSKVGALAPEAAAATGDGASRAAPSRWTGKDKTARTGDCRPSASIAARGPTPTSTYPGATCAPTAKGRAGFPSTEINAAPWPTRLAITPDKENLSAGPGPGPAATRGAAPRRRASSAKWLASGRMTGGARSSTARTLAESPTCVQYQPDTATPAQTITVAKR